MRLIEQTPTRLVLAQQRPLLAVMMLVFVGLCVGMLGSLVWQTTQLMADFSSAQWLAIATWGLLGIGLLALAVWMLASAFYGNRLTLDRDSQRVTLRCARRLGQHTQEFAIFAISGLAVSHNADLNVFALMLVLRSGQQVALATVSPFAEQELHTLTRQVREFLNAPYHIST